MAISLPRLNNTLKEISSVTSTANNLLGSSGIRIPNTSSSIQTVTKNTLNSINAISTIAEQVGVLSNQVSGGFQSPANSFRNITNTVATIDLFASSLNKQTSGITGLLNSDVTNAISTATGIFGSVGQTKALSNILQGPVGSISTISNSIESITSIVPTELTNLNTTFSSPLTTAFDLNRNILQDSRNTLISQINPGLANVNQLLQTINKDTETGISGVLGKLPSLGSTVSQSLGNLNLQTLSSKISNLIPSSVSKIPTDLGNVLNPLGNVVGDVNSKLNNLSTGLNQLTSGNPIQNFGIPIGNVANKINEVGNKINSISSNVNAITGVLQNPNQLTNIFESKIKNLVQSNLIEAFNPITSIVGSLSTLGKSLAEQANLDIDKIKVLAGTEISTLAGGRFDDNARRLVELVSNIENVQSAFVTSSNKSEENLKAVFSQYKEGRDKSLKLGNELRNFNTYNYIITLGMLTAAQYNDPSTYQTGGLNRILARSGGGDYNKRIQTFNEVTTLNGGHAEYFIEDLEIDSILAPNPNTGVAMGTNVSFRIVEPYSMGQFLEAVKQEANANNFSSTGRAPFCLKIEFLGWDEYGNANESISSQIKPRYVPIIITKMDFSVNEQGSIYDIQAVAYGDAALEDNVNSIKTDISSQGVYVHEILENSNESISREINKHIENLESDKKIVGYDRYLILFPNNKTDIFEAIRGSVTSEQVSALTAAEQLTIEQGASTTIQPDNPQTTVVAQNTTPYGPPKIYTKLKIWGSNKSNINVIGQSPVIEDTNSNRLVKHPDSVTIYNSETSLFQRDYAEAQVPEKSIAFEYRQDTSVTEIIEDVVMNSIYIFDAPAEQRPDAKKKWFRIETMVFIEENDDIDEQLGRPRMTYVYAVHPYFPDEAKFLSASEAPRNNDQLKAAAPKEYDYIYTGKNEDIIEFDINFNNAFFQLVLSDLNRGPQKPGTSTITQDTTEPSLSDTRSDSDNDLKPGTSLGTSSNTGGSNSGTPYTPETETKRRIAESFHDRLINSTVDMITCDMTIWGDPFYLPTDNGNYRSTPITASATQDGTMEFLNNEVTCVINFLTPLDYPNKAGQFVMDFPELVKPFSGLFHIWAVTNSFSSGKYTQQLKLIRRPRQTDTPTGTRGTTTTAPQRRFGTFNPNGTIQGAGQAARPGSRPPPTPTVTGGTPAANRPLPTAPIGSVGPF